MKLAYGFSVEDFRALQAPFHARPGHNAGFKGVASVCALIALLGLWLMARGLGILTGGFLIGLGALAAAVAYQLDKWSIRRKKERYERNLALAYQRVHCRDQRTLEVGDAGFTVSCKCGSVTRPWPELNRFSENNRSFFIGTKTDAQMIPKSAFSSEGEITEFRKLILDKLNNDRPFTARPIEFSYTRADFRHAWILHLLRAGGWRLLLRRLAISFVCAYGIYTFWGYSSSHHASGLFYGGVGGLLTASLLGVFRRRRKHYFGPLKIYFGEEGLHLQDPSSQGRLRWDQLLGYLEDDRAYLLYHNPRFYRIIPKRALAGREEDFQKLIRAVLPVYDYRRTPLSPRTAKV